MQSECLHPQALVHSLGCHGPDAATAFLISLLSSAQSSSVQRQLKQEAVYLSSALYLHSGSSQICLARPAPKKQSAGEKKNKKRLQKDKSIEKHPLSLHFTIPQSLYTRFLSLLYSVLSHDVHFIIVSFAENFEFGCK